MSINKKIIITVAAGLVLSVSSCRKFLDVNTNPNIAPTATVQTLLPAGQLYITSSLGVDLQITGSMWAGFWTQSPNSSQYRAIEQYAPGQDQFANGWENLYAANANFYQMYKLADSQKKKHYKALSLMLQAYTFQLLTDGWGDVPFKQALKGLPSDGGFLNPKYDSQAVVYSGVMSYIDSAEALLAQTDAAGPGSDDLIYGGDITKWQKFGYTLKLRMLMRLSERAPLVAQAGIAALYATPGVQFLGIGDDAKIIFGYSSTNKNPLYAEMTSTQLASTQNIVASSTAVDSFNSNFDDRAYIFYTYLSNGSVVGIPQGAYNLNVAGGTYSIPSEYTGGNAQAANSSKAPVNFLTSSESYFLQAEVEARGWAVTGSSDAAWFYAGINASFNQYNDAMLAVNGYTADSSYNRYIDAAGTGTGGGYWTLYPAGGTQADKLRYIITQKWFAMCGNQGFEAWNELRRTGYPDFFVRSSNSQIGAQDPVRLLYPTSESTRNSAFPGVQTVTTKMWWDLF